MTRCIKVLANLDIAEKRLPQDGRIFQEINGKQVDLRVSILPTVHGEKTVIRFIYRNHRGFTLSEIGFKEEDYIKIKQLLKNPYGIILLTGPTGSGKSTTLAASLKWLNHESINMITVEDPVENVIEGISQVAVNTKIGLDFSKVLRAILRQDPDVLMIGEMRDEETAGIAIRAAITGHLVLSTLHTNNAISSIPRLIDMGVEDYMVAAAVKGVISQRLIRRLCPVCRKKHQVTATEAIIYKVPEGIMVYKPKGCKACNHIGYKGRMAIYEILMISQKLQEMIAKGERDTEILQRIAEEEGMHTLWQNAYEHVLNGDTSMEEMLRVTYKQ
ncbi:GspE/PulE family protein [Cellulosilyticum ruminicola]|uniref:GspE/PulE family protein n=1 Tax=Cellulosilyticum ruminicola TaxID=425254 RepID=UPI0006D16C64|nr:GspE/PulE family protein [Cellulosilyticum ruminicola]